MYVSSVLIYGCEPWEFQKAYAWQVLIDYRDMKKNVSSKKYPIYQYPVLKLNVVGIQSMYKENLQFVQHI